MVGIRVIEKKWLMVDTLNYEWIFNKGILLKILLEQWYYEESGIDVSKLENESVSVLVSIHTGAVYDMNKIYINELMRTKYVLFPYIWQFKNFLWKNVNNVE